MVGPGERAGWTDGPLSRPWSTGSGAGGDAQGRARTTCAPSSGSSRRRKNCCGPATRYRSAPRPPGHGRCRQGRDHQTRHVRGEPTGLRGGRLQGPSAMKLEHDFSGVTARRCPAGSDRHLQPLLLRGSAGGQGPSGAPRAIRPAHPPTPVAESLWARRYEDINAFEQHLHRAGTRIVKVYLHVSRDEQTKAAPRAAERPGQTLEVFHDGSGRTQSTGTSTASPTRRRSTPRRRPGRRGMSFRRTTSTSPGPGGRDPGGRHRSARPPAAERQP